MGVEGCAAAALACCSCCACCACCDWVAAAAAALKRWRAIHVRVVCPHEHVNWFWLNGTVLVAWHAMHGTLSPVVAVVMARARGAPRVPPTVEVG